MKNKWLKAVILAGIIWFFFMGVGYAFPCFKNILPWIVNQNVSAEKNETLSYPSRGLNKVTVSTFNGPIILVGQEDATEITVQANYRVWGGSQNDAEAKLATLSTKIVESTRGSLTIEGVFEGSKTNNSISYVISLPPHILVEANTSNGRIEVSDLYGDLQLITSNGRINVETEKGPGQLVARTSNGRIFVKARPVGNSIDLHTSNGRIDIVLPADLGITLSARTSNGKINLGESLWAIQGGELSKKTVDARRGNGRLRLTAMTSNGNISLSEL